MNKPFLIGIAGGTGSGKTLLTATLANKYGHIGVAILDQDSYYLDQSHLTEEERKSVNYDEAYALDHDLIFQHLTELLSGRSIYKPRYSFISHTRQPRGEPVDPKPIVLFEGLFALWDTRCRALMDLKVFLDAEPDLRFIRRLRRDLLERGRSAESVIGQYIETVRPMHRLYVQPTRAYADLVMDSTGSFDLVVMEVDRAISEHCAKRSAGRLH